MFLPPGVSLCEPTLWAYAWTMAGPETTQPEKPDALEQLRAVQR